GEVPAGLSFDTTIDTRYSSTPTAIKKIAMIAAVLCTLIALAALARLDTSDGRGAPPGRAPGGGGGGPTIPGGGGGRGGGPYAPPQALLILYGEIRQPLAERDGINSRTGRVPR
ncbi:hypothetical protein, partial [Nocardia cyriacigeorgica]|uniref:hypothetical protein n=1 Tax=Nocardia cyriacigeorgica TaxID=135487 RepID=UPI002455D618